jgi:hypothetical protein
LFVTAGEPPPPPNMLVVINFITAQSRNGILLSDCTCSQSRRVPCLMDCLEGK